MKNKLNYAVKLIYNCNKMDITEEEQKRREDKLAALKASRFK